MFTFLKILFRIIFVFILILGITALYARFIEPYRLTTTNIVIENAYAPEDFEEVKIAIFADTHFSEYYTLKHFEKVKNAINESNPDIILFCGDLIDNFEEYDGDVQEISSALADLKAPLGKFAVYGNHDYGGGAFHSYRDIMEDGGFKVFVGEYFAFDEMNLAFIGLDDFIFGSKSTDVATWAREDYFNFLFSHEPDIADLILKDNIDFMTTGHTHGGQINVPFYQHVYFPSYGQKYIKGSYTFDNERSTTLYVNSGIGMTKLPFRFMAPPEVTFVTITKAA